FEGLKSSSKTQAFMDTPYRLDRVVSELLEGHGELSLKQSVYLVCDINRESERSFWGTLSELKRCQPLEKAEFVLVLAGNHPF
ncbi:MAG: hypothetical protein NXH75_05585, partial [Halobacteriovoraceae bacterium]|nr:hypothetical protein [Halobacteriovoraceae bacterium]